MKRAAVLLLILVIAGAVVFGLVTVAPRLRWYSRVSRHAVEAALREPAALQEWRKEFGDPVETLWAFPTRDDNTTAVRLVELAPGAGVDFDGSPESTASLPAIADYVNAESMKTGGSVGPPPEAVRSYLDAHARGIGAVVDLLIRAEPAAWKTDVSLKVSAPVPNWRALRRLNDVVAAEALAQSSRGHDGDAERALLASWQLNASLRDRPDLFSQLLAVSLMHTQTGLARRLRIDPASWRARLGDHDYRASVMRALVVDAIHGLRMLPAGASQLDRASRADYLDLMRSDLVRLRDLQIGAPLAGELNPAAPSGEVLSIGEAVAAGQRPGADRSRFITDRLILDAELTDRVLHARLLRARLGRWPAAIPDLERSRMAGVHWVYVVGQEGRMSISLSQPLQGSGLPLRFESRE